MTNRQNPFTALLDLLKVKHTRDFSNQYFNEHPHKYNLLGLSKMLSDYDVENAGTKIVDKENELSLIEMPFIAHSGGEFVVVYKTTKSPEGDLDPESFIHCLRNGKNVTIPTAQFIQSWSGVVLLAETTPNSIEPDYQEHRKKELLNIAQKTILILAVALIFGITFFNQLFNTNQLFSYSVIQLFRYSVTQLFRYSITPLFSYSILSVLIFLTS
jgi:ABC-type bacteriocin/lantibiotic exporter with double-glycine peptidase domain